MIRTQDTSKESSRMQLAVIRQIGLAGRDQMTFHLCDTLRQITKAGIRHRHPDYTEQQVTQAYLRLILDENLYQQIFPENEISV